MASTLLPSVARRAQAALSTSPIYDLRDLCVEELDDVLVINGTVSSFYHKQMAQEVVRNVAESMPVRNQAVVR